MNCPNCNYEIYEETRFCPKCGTDLAQYNMFANIDKGANMATASMICGILALFTGPFLAIPSLIFASKYKKIGNGENAKNAKVGKVCSWISLGTIFAIILLTLTIGGLFILINARTTGTENINISSGYTEEYSDIKEEGKEDLNINSSDLFANIENRYYTEADEINADSETILLYEKVIPDEGIEVYNSNGIVISFDDFYIQKDKQVKLYANITASIDDDRYKISVDYPTINDIRLYGSVSSYLTDFQSFAFLDDFDLTEIEKVTYPFEVVDINTEEVINTIYISIPIN